MLKQRKKEKCVKEFLCQIQKMLKNEFPFLNFFQLEKVKPENFIIDLFPCLKESIEDCFCATVKSTSRNDLLVQFDTGECLELQLLCKVR